MVRGVRALARLLDGALTHALGGESIEPRFRLLEPRLARLIMRHGFEFEQIPALLAGRDLSLVLSTWWDPAPQTVFESFACGVPVLGAELGGIPDFVHDGVNGLLFRGNDPADLARRLASIIDHPDTLHRLRDGVRPPKDIAVHAAELEAIYTGADVAAPATRDARITISTPTPTPDSLPVAPQFH